MRQQKLVLDLIERIEKELEKHGNDTDRVFGNVWDAEDYKERIDDDCLLDLCILVEAYRGERSFSRDQLIRAINNISIIADNLCL